MSVSSIAATAAILLLVSECECKAAPDLSEFTRVRQCPVRPNLRQVTLSSRILCAGVCRSSGAQFRCNAFHFDPTSRACYLGDACSSVAQWTVGDCDSYIIKTVSAADASYFSCDLFSQLQMKLFYKFKKSGLVNEADPTRFALTASDLTVSSDGAEFKGTSSSRLRTATPGFEQFLDYDTSYSFFVKVLHANTRQQIYFRLSQCGGSESTGNVFVKDLPRVYGYAFWTRGGYDKTFSMSDDFLIDSGSPTLVSTGFAYNRTGYQHFYFNRTLQGSYPSFAYSTAGVSTNASNFQCLNIGYSSNSAICLIGNMHCFGMSTRALSLNEFIRLEDYCDAV